ncbi:MAG: hypothetical protein HC794_02655, partial [Nitrospiraceae bacterium]|nr:hypothetical protein [Nitrospiraceae bacterium]
MRRLRKAFARVSPKRACPRGATRSPKGDRADGDLHSRAARALPPRAAPKAPARGFCGLLLCGLGFDRLDGGFGLDTLTGGAGNDRFVLHADQAAEDADTVTDFTNLQDRFLIEGADGKIIAYTQSGANTLITADGVLV